MNVKLLSYPEDPIRTLYVAYRTAYSRLTPEKLHENASLAGREQMLTFIDKRMEVGHVSPLYQVHFEFAISGVSRAFSHQFVRHHIGLDLEQQSQRYVSYEGKTFQYVTPRTIAKSDLLLEYEQLMQSLQGFYDRLCADGVPPEDARFVLPNATATNIKCTVNFAELLHIADLRLCTQAQWEFRKVVAMMRGEVMRACPELGKYIQPKCGELRAGYCDESKEAWEKCPLGRKRPHKTQVQEWARSFERALDTQDYSVIEGE